MTFPWLFYHPLDDPYIDYLVLWMKGIDYVDYSPYGTAITNNGSSSDGSNYIGDGLTSFETSDHSSNFVLFNTSFTIMFDLKRQSDAWGAIIGKARQDDSAANATQYWLITTSVGLGSNPPLNFIWNPDGGSSYTLSSTNSPAADGTFHTYKYTYDGTTLKLWIDGTLDVSTTISPFTDQTYKLGIMAEDSWPGPPYLGYGSTGTSYKALLKEVKIYRGIAIE
jgi:hypothetical protein